MYMTFNRSTLLAAALLLSVSAADAQGLKTLPPGERPVKVSIGSYLIDFQEIDENTLSHTMTGYLTLQWRDPRLAKGASKDFDAEKVALDQIWSPNIEITNEHEPRSTSNTDIKVTDDGVVTYEERFKAKLSTDFDLRRFPLDSQRLFLGIESFRYDKHDVVFVPQQGKALQSPFAFLPDWHIVKVSQGSDEDPSNPDNKVYSRYTFEVDVQRQVGYYVWNVFLPIAFITLLAWLVFFVTPDDLQTRVGVSMTALLTAIALSLVISANRPRVSYLTLMDAIFLNCYFLIFMSAAAVVVAHVMIKSDGNAERADRLSRTGRVAYPLLWIATNAAIMFRFLVLIA
jgi:hypothetical protein